jgi:hypothetical protein
MLIGCSQNDFFLDAIRRVNPALADRKALAKNAGTPGPH